MNGIYQPSTTVDYSVVLLMYFPLEAHQVSSSKSAELICVLLVTDGQNDGRVGKKYHRRRKICQRIFSTLPTRYIVEV